MLHASIVIGIQSIFMYDAMYSRFGDFNHVSNISIASYTISFKCISGSDVSYLHAHLCDVHQDASALQHLPVSCDFEITFSVTL